MRAGMKAALAWGAAAAVTAAAGLVVAAGAPAGARYRPAPDFELADLQAPGGERLRLSSHRGRVVLINLWASWCQPCVRELPLLVDLHRRYHDRGLDVLAVNVEQDGAAARTFVRARAAALGLPALPFDVPWDPAGTVRASYQPKVLPATFLVDTEGRLRYAHHGFGQGYLPRVPPRIEALLAGPPAPLAKLASAAQAKAELTDISHGQVDPGIAVDLRYAGPDNFTGAPLPGYHARRALLRRPAAMALARAAVRLARRGKRLKVYDAYRPVRATAAMVDWARQNGREELLRDGYIAGDSQHNLGQAVDCTLIGPTGTELDMGSAFDTFSPVSHFAAAGISEAAARNRAELRAVLMAEGFVPFEREWWHFSFPLKDPLRFDVPVR
jgi:D-alanyl-D-alanine dipeptidase